MFHVRIVLNLVDQSMGVANPKVSVRGNLRRGETAGIVAGLVVLILSISFSFQSVRAINRAAALEANTRNILVGLRDLVTHLTSAENSLYAYLLTGDEQTLQSYYAEAPLTQLQVEAMELRLEGDSLQQRHFQTLKTLLAQQSVRENAIVEARQRMGPVINHADAVGTRRSFMNDIAAVCDIMEKQALSSLRQGKQHLTTPTRVMAFMLPIGAVISLLILGFVVLLANNEIKACKHREEELKRANAELEHRVDQRSAALQTANEDLERFSYSVSHDLRAPLRGIDGFARVLDEEHAAQLSPEGLRLIGIVRGEARRMGRLIDDLLSFSRIGRQQMKLSQIDMTALAKSVFEELVMSQSRSIQFELNVLPPVRGDIALIRQVWVNLLSNAIKFTRDEAAPRIEVGAREQDGVLAFYVDDNGVGFDMAYAGKLFGVFQRLHAASHFEGSGVGLALAQRIIQRHGGRIWAESRVKCGATFYFTLNPTETL